jgi:hypothetical protein
MFNKNISLLKTDLTKISSKLTFKKQAPTLILIELNLGEFNGTACF